MGSYARAIEAAASVVSSGASEEAARPTLQRDGEGQRRSGHQYPLVAFAGQELDTAFGQSQDLSLFAGSCWRKLRW